MAGKDARGALVQCTDISVLTSQNLWAPLPTPQAATRDSGRASRHSAAQTPGLRNSTNISPCALSPCVRVGRNTRFWEGGQGCRDVRRLNRNDPRKHRGRNKTASNKASRVGPKPWSGKGGGGQAGTGREG